MTAHPSRNRLEELTAGSSRAGDAELRTHVDGCGACSARVAAMQAARSAFLRRRTPTEFARSVMGKLRTSSARPKRPRRFLRVAPYVLAAASLVLVCIRLTAPSAGTIRLKGSSRLDVFVRRNGHAQALHDGEALMPGDQLAFAYTIPDARNLLLLSIDDSGIVTRYFPRDASTGSHLGPALRAQLPMGVELDAHRGEERLFALFSRDAIDEAKTRAALERALRDAKSSGGGIASMNRLALPLEQSSVWFRKP